MSLFINTLSRFVIAFLPRCNRLLISWLPSPSAVILELKKRKSVTASIFFPFYLPWSDGTDAMILVLILSFKLAFTLSSFTLFKRLFISAIRVVSSAYLRLLIFLPADLILAYNSSSPAFHMKCFSYKLNEQGDNIQFCHTPFSILIQSVVM